MPFFIRLISMIFFSLLTTSICHGNDIFFISSDGVRVRSLANESAKILGLLNLNDQVKKINLNPPLLKNFIEIEILQSSSEIIESKHYYISDEFLSVEPIDYKEFKGKYFIVINVASEILRLYERICDNEICYNKMKLETETVVGEDKNNPPDGSGKGRSILGSFRINAWKKFYEDSAGHYPAWFNQNYPPVPPPGNQKPMLWFADKYMPVDANGKKNGKMRGAFGWYTALVMPAPFGQWMHGTTGWGEDKDFYITFAKTVLTNILFDPRSSGCIRSNNEAIAYLRDIVETGAPIIKIYAEERVFDPTNPIYNEKWARWNYVLTKLKNQKAGRAEVMAALNATDLELEAYWHAKRSGLDISIDPLDPLNNVLEVGTYTMDIHPDASKFVPGEKISRWGRKVNRNGNVYGIKSKDMSGVFYVDTGLLANYAHPKAVVHVSGYLDEVTPPWMKK